MEVAAQSGLDAMTSVETNPNERGLGKPCAGKPPARFDEGASSVAAECGAALSTLLNAKLVRTNTGQKGRRPAVMLLLELSPTQQKAVRIFELARWIPSLSSTMNHPHPLGAE